MCDVVDPTGESSKEILETVLNVHLLGKMGPFFSFGGQIRLFRKMCDMIYL